MHIEFNPGRKSSSPAVAAETSTRQGKPSAAATISSEASSFQSSGNLETKLSQPSQVRAEKVQQVQLRLLSQEYPPQVMVDRVADLLAAHFKN
jgi:hypothetical protein